MENGNVTDSVLNSYNDVNLRWIARDNWKYSLNFGGKLVFFPLIFEFDLPKKKMMQQ